MNFYKFKEIENLDILKIKGIITNNCYEKKLIYEKLKEKINSEDIEVMTIKNWCEYYLQRIPIGIINKEKIYKIENKISSIKVKIQIFFKSIMESIFAFFLLIVSSPIIVISASLIYLEDKGPIFYKQQRIGLKGKVFNIYKIRSMRENAENDGPQWAKK